MNEAGMPVTEALQLATLVNAEILGESNRLGQLAPGFLADIVATDENPETSIQTLKAVTFVMKNGVVIKNE